MSDKSRNKNLVSKDRGTEHAWEQWMKENDSLVDAAAQSYNKVYQLDQSLINLNIALPTTLI